MKCKICGADFDPLQVKSELSLFNFEYDGLLCYKCAAEHATGLACTDQPELCMSDTEIGRAYREAIDKETALLQSLLEQTDPNSQRMQELTEQLFNLMELQDVPPEDLARDLWVRQNITLDWTD